MDRQAPAKLHRIVKSNPPTEEDFWSHERLGIPLFDPSHKELYSGVSTYERLEMAREKARTYPDKGTFIAVLDVRTEEGVRCKRTGSRRNKHYTLWAEPKTLLGCVVAVEPV